MSTHNKSPKAAWTRNPFSGGKALKMDTGQQGSLLVSTQH